MFASKVWPLWDSIKETELFKSTINDAFNISLAPVYIGGESLTGFFLENGTIIHCTLSGFSGGCCIESTVRNHSYKTTNQTLFSPCKHTIRLLYELGYIDRGGNKTPPIVAEKHFVSSIFLHHIEAIENQPTAQQIKLLDLLSDFKSLNPITHAFFPICIYSDTFKLFEALSIFRKSLDQSIVIESPFGFVKSAEAVGISFPEHLTRTKAGKISFDTKYQWCLQNIENIVPIVYPNHIAINIQSSFLPYVDAVKSYLKRKFWDTSRNINNSNGLKSEILHPYDATRYEDGFAFPDDIVTTALNLHNCNRCTTWTPGIKVASHIVAWEISLK